MATDNCLKLNLGDGNLYGGTDSAPWPAYISAPGALAELTADEYDSLVPLPAWERLQRWRETHPEEGENPDDD